MILIQDCPLKNSILLTPFGHRKVFCKKAIQKQSKMNQWCPKTRAIHFTLKIMKISTMHQVRLNL
eukprot:14999273-Ditylum_brightwellii.AAC.1